MQDLTRCVASTCPWRKECVRAITYSKVKKGEAFFVSPWTNEGCEHFLTTELLNIEKLKNPTKDI